MKKGFTLAELLIALAILGVIGTFTIPKVLQSQQDGKYKAMAKEAASMISGAFDAYKQTNNPPPANMADTALTPFFNYVKIDTSTVIQDTTGGSLACGNPSQRCFILHNGAYIRTHSGRNFGGTSSTNAIYFYVDPDGASPQPSVVLMLYYNGRLTSGAQILPNTCHDNSGVNCNNPGDFADPSWFSWN